MFTGASGRHQVATEGILGFSVSGLSSTLSHANQSSEVGSKPWCAGKSRATSRHSLGRCRRRAEHINFCFQAAPQTEVGCTDCEPAVRLLVEVQAASDLDG